MTLIKICGITNKVDAVGAADLGVDMLGFVFYEKSQRYVGQNTARQIINELPDRIAKVGVFVNEDADKVRAIAEDAQLDTLQFHGDETPEYCSIFKNEYKVIRAFRVLDKKDIEPINKFDVDYYLIDSPKHGYFGGTGETFDWKVIKDFEFLKPVLLSGGLNPGNVARAISEVVPFGVDVSTGVEERPGKKSPQLMKSFVEEVRKV